MCLSPGGCGLVSVFLLITIIGWWGLTVITGLHEQSAPRVMDLYVAIIYVSMCVLVIYKTMGIIYRKLQR